MKPAMNFAIKVALFSILLFRQFGATCQTDFRPGFIITNNNDTLHGLIDYRGDARNSRKCDFKESKNSAVKEFLPFSIKGYRFNVSKYYVSKKFISNYIEVPIFFEFLVDGIADLYYYNDGIDPHYFIEKAGGELFELTNDKKKVQIEGTEYIEDSKKYIGLLTFAFSDCQQIFPLINKAKLDDKSLIEITKKYHENVCNGEKCIIYEKQVPSVRLRISPFISMNSSGWRIGNNPLYENVKFRNANYPSIGMSLNTSLPKASEKLSFQLSAEIGKSYFHGTGTYSSEFEEVQFHVTLLSLKGGLKYTYPVGKIRPTLLIGGNLIKPVNRDGRRIGDYQYYNTIYTSETRDVPGPDFLFGYHAELGFDFIITSTFTAFVNLGYVSSMNSKSSWESQTRVDNYSSAYLKTVQFTIGIYL